MESINKWDALSLLYAVVEYLGANYVYTDPYKPGKKPVPYIVPFSGEIANGGVACEYAIYGEDGAVVPSCVVGYALFIAGQEINHLNGYADEIRLYDCDLTQAALQVFRVAQVAQDMGAPYGAAYRVAEYVADILEGE